MTSIELQAAIAGYLGRMDARRNDAVHIEQSPVYGGLTAKTTSRLSATYRDVGGAERRLNLIAKEISGAAAREAEVYRTFVMRLPAGIAPVLVDVIDTGPDSRLLLLEAIEPRHIWPWHDERHGRLFMGRLASLHGPWQPADAALALPEWSYEDELAAAAARTMESIDRCRFSADLAPLGRRYRSLCRIVEGLPLLRRQLLSTAPIGTAVIHGDVHPGNVLVRAAEPALEPVLIDWGRARIGSPLEDVSSWLQSLRYFEPVAHRRHDSMFAAYLSTLGVTAGLSPTWRTAYWLAGASNALAGALHFHVTRAADERLSSVERGEAFRAAADWLRVIRRADAYFS